MQRLPGLMPTSRSSMSQYLANLCQQICTLPQTMLGRSVGLPAARCRSRHRHFAAMPPSIAASLEPTVEQPNASPGACQRSASMRTQRLSISAVC